MASELRIDQDLPSFVLRAADQTIGLPVYFGDTNSPTAPTSGTYTLYRPAGTALISARATANVSSVPTVTIAAADVPITEDFGDYWVESWALVISSVTYVVERRAAMVRQILRCPVTNATLLRYHPDLSTYPAGASSWEPSVIKAAWTWTERCLLETGKRPEKVIGADALEPMTRYMALGLACRSVSTYVGDSERWQALADRYDREPETDEDRGGLAQQAWAKIRPWYDADDDGIPEAGEREADTFPAGRSW